MLFAYIDNPCHQWIDLIVIDLFFCHDAFSMSHRVDCLYIKCGSLSRKLARYSLVSLTCRHRSSPLQCVPGLHVGAFLAYSSTSLQLARIGGVLYELSRHDP